MNKFNAMFFYYSITSIASMYRSGSDKSDNCAITSITSEVIKAISKNDRKHQ